MTVDRFPAEVRPIVAQAEALERRVYELERRLGRGNPRGPGCPCPTSYCASSTTVSASVVVPVADRPSPGTILAFGQANVWYAGLGSGTLGIALVMSSSGGLSNTMRFFSDNMPATSPRQEERLTVSETFSASETVTLSVSYSGTIVPSAQYLWLRILVVGTEGQDTFCRQLPGGGGS